MQVTWKSPSNIALVKYWGKHGHQLPNNPSVSFTLQQCYSETTVQISPKEVKSNDLHLRFFFEGKENMAFRLRILQFMESILPYFRWLSEVEVTIHSANSFPHSAGIASSASALSSLALCFMQLDLHRKGVKKAAASDWRKASEYARIGSGSACRSVYGYAAAWGKTTAVKGSSDRYAVPIELHPTFRKFQDTILIAAGAEKKVSSRAGHSLMEKNPYAAARYEQARGHMKKLIPALQQGDLETFIQITEQEALTLHALMMASNPGYILINENTLQLIDLIRRYREKTKIPVCFTLDAGPNIHLLYPQRYSEKINTWIGEELSSYCENGRFIQDHVGKGPQLIR